MPFCNQCGSRNPDDARFCSQCGSRLATADAAAAGESAPGGESPTETTATITFGVPDGASERTPDKAETSDRNLSPVDAAAVDALPSGHALLVVQKGPGAGSRFLLDKDLVHSGRHPESDIFLDDVTVSRRHAEFTRVGSGFSVADVGSLNGTYVNRDRIDNVDLRDGDEVQIGKYRLVFFAGPGQ